MSEKTEIIISARDETKQAIAGVVGSLDKLKGVAVGMGPIFAGLTTALSIGAFKSSIEGAISFAAALDDMAERTGATVENLSALSGVAKIGGHDLGTVETGLQRLSKALHSTDEDSKGAGKALAALGLNIDELRNKDTAEAMLDVAKAMAKFEDGSGKTAVAIALLGKNGAALLPFLKDLAEKSELVGKITTEQAAMAEQYEKNIMRLSTAMSTLSKTVAMELLPSLNKLTSEMVSDMDAAGGFWKAMLSVPTMPGGKTIDAQIDKVRASMAALGNDQSKMNLIDQGRFSLLSTQLNMLEGRKKLATQALASAVGINDIEKKGSLNDFVGEADKKPKKEGTPRADPAKSLLQTLQEQIAVKQLDLQTTENMTGAEKEAAKVMADLASGRLKATAAQKMQIAATLEELIGLDKSLQAQKEMADAIKRQEESNLKSRQAMLDRIAAAGEEADLYGLTAAQISAVQQARLEDAIAIAEENGASEEHIAALKEELAVRARLTDALAAKELKIQGVEDAKKAIDAVNELDEFTKQAARNMQDAMAEFFINPTRDGMESLATSFGKTVQKMIVQAGSAQLMNLLFGDMGKTGKLGTDSLVGKGIGWLSEFFNFANGGIMTSAGPIPLKSYAGGGIANSPQLTLFGEGRTPEAYVPLPDGRRIPVAMQGGGGSPVIQHLNFYGAAEPAQVKRAAAAGYRNAAGAMATAGRYA